MVAENSVEYGIAMLAALYAKAPILPIAPAYLQHDAHERFREILDRFRPRLLLLDSRLSDASLSGHFRNAGIAWFTLGDGDGSGRRFEHLCDVAEAPDTDAFAASLRQSDIAKIMLTSGSTGRPKGVINTHGMLTSGVRMMRSVLPEPDSERQFKYLDWLPWHHTYGGNVIFNGALLVGGALYIDDGRPTKELIGRTVENIIEVGPTILTGVPVTMTAIEDYLERHPSMAERVLASVQALSYGGAGISPVLLRRLRDRAVPVSGKPAPVLAGYGMTETAGVILSRYWESDSNEVVGLPPPGVEVKLVPLGNGEWECRVRGPNVTPGYWNDPDLTREAFDGEGFLITGDVLRWADEGDALQGLCFVRRLGEDFKLASGTFVRVGSLRARLDEALGDIAQYCAIVGENRDEIGLLLWLRPPVGTPGLLHAALERHNQAHRGSSVRIGRYALMAGAPSSSLGEHTPKGTLSNRAVMQTRRADVEALYEGRIGVRL
jgi:feruloyl-CoA synthase